MEENFNDFLGFLLELDCLKKVERKNYINNGERRENSAEHSWHLAMASWALAKYFKRNYSIEKLLKLSLIHDLGEIDAGDTFLYDEKRTNAFQSERECMTRLNSLPGNHIDNLLCLWDEQENGSSEESKFIKVVDRILPFLHNIKSSGKAWKENNVRKSQVLEAQKFIEDQEPEIYKWILLNIDEAVKKGWLEDS